MCGICGIVSSENLCEGDFSLVSAMNDSMVHRGPDDSGQFRDTNLMLAMRRLSIIDIAGGKQPLTNEDGSIVLIANGEIYNYLELRDELKARGHQFRTGSDCETIVHLYEEFGVESLAKLRGMFAFALWDKRSRQLFLARDRIGEKPLYLCREAGRLIFASELRTLIRAMPRGFSLDTAGVDMYMHYQYVPEPMTIIKNVSKLQAGHFMLISSEPWHVVSKRYWNIESVSPIIDSNPPQRILQELQDVTSLTLRSDVPVGVALSGGMDSNAIAALSAPKYKGELHAFTVGYEGRPECDERDKAKSIAKEFGLPFHEIEITADGFVNSFPELVNHCDDPIADIAAYGYFSVMKEARKNNVPVMLTGFGGDELFWGYPWVVEAMIENARRLALLGNSAEGYRQLGRDLTFYERHYDFKTAEQTLPMLYTSSFMADIPPQNSFKPFRIDEPYNSLPVRICRALFDTWLVPNCIVLGDRLSMASSVEVRLPLLDYKLVELVMGLRKTYTTDYTLQPKTWLKEAMINILPEGVMNYPKRGFTPPVQLWIDKIIQHYGPLLADGCLIQNRIFDADKVRQLLTRPHSGLIRHLVYKMLLLEVWCRSVLAGQIRRPLGESYEKQNKYVVARNKISQLSSKVAESAMPDTRKSSKSLNMQVIGSEYGGWAVDLDLIPSGSTVISAGVGEDISFDLGLVSLKNCKVIGIDPTEKARKYVEQNKNENLSFLQKALYSQSNEKIRIYESSNPDWVSESITPSHNTVNPSDFYEAQTIGLQELLERHRDISVLKMDIEGAEYDVLNSIDKLDIPQICVEFHHFCTAFTVDDTDRCIEHLKDMGYIVAHCTYKAGAIKEATFVHQKCIRKDAAATKPDTSAGRTVPDIPVILVCYNRPKHTLEVLRALKQHDVKNIYIFSDAPKRQEDTQAVSLVRRLVHSIDWTEPKIIERTENLGLARNIVSAVDYVFERYDRLILLEDDCVPQRYFFDFMQICLKKYENNPKVFGISGYTVAIPDEILRSYPYDLYACPRIGSWGWATWKRAWKHYGRDLRKLVKIANEGNVDLTQGGADIPIFIEKFLKGQLKDVWTLNWVLSVYINGGVYIYPTRSHIRNVGMDGIGLHCRRTDKYDSPCSDIRPTRYPEDIFLDERIMESFKSYYAAAPQRSRRAVHFLKSLRQKKALKIAQINTVDKKGGAARVAWMLKEGLKDRGLQTKMFVGGRSSEDSDVQTIINPVIDAGDDYKNKGFLYYDINSTFLLSRNNDFISSDIFHFHNLHGNYFNPFALPELTKIRPSVWTLHDMQSMTGHCAYAFDCNKWQNGCGECPYLEAYPSITKDRTAEMWRDKKLIYQESDFELIVPSRWLKDIVEKSMLKDKNVHLIYNGIDERIYRPYDKYAARKKLHIPDNSIVLGFVSHKGLMSRRKGGDFILEAYRYFISKYPNVYFVCIGGKSSGAPTERFLQIPYVSDENLLAETYCAADVFMFPTLADNCPLVVLELMACGVPVVSFNVGGVPELIENGKTGFVAGYKNGPEFVQMTERLVLDRARQKEFSHAGLERLQKMFTLERMIDEHVCLYEKLAENAEKKSYVPPEGKVALPASYSEVKYEYLVSAIVSTYNSERFLRGCLDDLERQTIADKLEIIVVNSGSQENEEAIVREYQQSHNNIVYIKTEQREGVYAAWNRAVKAARGKFITNANTDDRHREDALEIMAKTLLANPDVALVYGDQICTDTPNGTFANHHATEIAKRPEYSQGRLLFGCCVGSQPMWRKSLHNEFGYFDDTLTCAADWDFWLRISSKYKFKHIPECLGLYYYNKDGIEHGKKIHSLYERYIVGKRYGNPYISVIPLYQSRDNPLISVIMPAYNAAEYIAEAIESILIQNYRNFELVVVDDGSTDNTKDIVASFKDDRIKYIYKENAGVASARNLAIRQAKGQYVMLLDSDDMMVPDCIAAHLQEFEKYPEADLAYSDVLLIDGSSKPIRVMKKPEYQDRRHMIRDLFRAGHPIIPFRLGIRRSVFDKIGLYDEELTVAEDYDMIRRFVKAGLKAHHLSKPLHLRRVRHDSLSRTTTVDKARNHFDVVKRFTDTFAYDELFPGVAWDKIPSEMRQLHAKCLAAVTYQAMGQACIEANSTISAKTACELACSELNDCLKMDPGNQRIRQLLQKCEFGRQKYDERVLQAVR